MERDSKASLFSLLAVKLGVIKEDGKTVPHANKNCRPSHVQGKQQRETALPLSLSFYPLSHFLSLFYFYNLEAVDPPRVQICLSPDA